ncbi:MAG: IS1096 element passenger TnpR family protein [Paludibacteraceae bacterium]
MIFKFTILSDEVDDFVRTIEIDSEATFLDLHKAILNAVKYEDNQITSFFICTDDWEKKQEITLVEMESSSEYDNLVMEKMPLDELLDDEKQKLLYVFDLISDRAFFMELSDVIPGKSLDEAVCTSSIGKAPTQIALDLDVMPVATKKISTSSEENFYGDEEYDADELDQEGFGDLNFDEGNLFENPNA